MRQKIAIIIMYMTYGIQSKNLNQNIRGQDNGQNILTKIMLYSNDFTSIGFKLLGI